MKKETEKGFAILIVIVLVIVVLGLMGFLVFSKTKKAPSETLTSGEKISGKWSSPIKVIEGYADADVVFVGGKYRMYFGDVPGPGTFSHGIYSAISSDGKNFKMEDGVRQANASFPDVVEISDGKWRMYYQGNGGIQSSTSTDGLNWTQEQGLRIDTSNNSGLKITEIGAPTTMQTEDGSFVMVYRDTLSETYDLEAPNKGTNLLLWAASTDGLNFQNRGVAVDSRNSTYDGWLDGPDFSKWGSEIRLYFWTYSGIYYSKFDGKKFNGETLAIEAKSDNPMAKFSPNPPGDPTLIKIGNVWYMYYGSFGGGKQTVYYVTLQ